MPRAAARPRPTLVLFVRHGQTPTTGKVLPGRAPGLHLSDVGKEQARVAADAVAKLPKVDAIYASPLERARETAAPIAVARGLKVKIDRGLLELDVGDWTGEELKKVSRTPGWKVVQNHPSGFRFPGGESFVELQARIVGTIARLVAVHPGGTIVAVSHADTIKAAVGHALGTHLDMFQRLSISPCSVTAVAYAESGPMVLTVNWVSSLLSKPS
ncbi:MAG: MSMEG_4193 family putative phosphomutase [Acidimicrobiales bacterium]|nr:MSMEG_4193 family putative phosphomutase [Actinomycetota bacterium]